MKRVLIVYGGAKNRGGIHSYLQNLFEGLSGDRDVHLSLYSIGEWALSADLQREGFDVYSVKRKTWSLGNIFDLKKQIKIGNYDMVVSQGMVANFFSRIASVFTGVPNVVIIHSDWRTDYRGFKKLFFWISDRAFRFSTSNYVVVSEYLKSTLINEGIKSKQVAVIYNGVTYQKLNKKMSIRKNISKDKITIGSVGRLHPVKNFENLIRTIGLLNDNVSLEIAGEGSERPRLESLINELSLSGRVKLLGQRQDLSEVFRGWDIYIQPSLSEGFGLALVEAMTAGLLVIVSPGGSLPEIVKDGETGVVAKGFGPQDFVDAINWVQENKEKSSALAAAGQKYAKEKFSEEKWLSEMKKFLGAQK